MINTKERLVVMMRMIDDDDDDEKTAYYSYLNIIAHVITVI